MAERQRPHQAEDSVRPVVSVVSPVFGCESCLEELVDRVAEACGRVTDRFEIILVDDGSPDGAWATIRRLAACREWLRGFRLSRNFGQHSAISAGIAQALGEWIVVMDCDLQDPPEAIPDLLHTALEQDAYVVFAQRADRQDTALKRFNSWAFHRALQWLTGAEQDESTANFGIYRQEVIAAVVGMPERERAFPLMVTWTGFASTTMPVPHAKRSSGQSGYTLRKMIALAMSVVLGYSEKPLRMVAAGGVLCGFIAFALVGFTVYQFLAGDIGVAGYTSILASIWLLGGLVLTSLGILGLYVGQVFRNVQGRPSSIVAETVGTPVHYSSDGRSEARITRRVLE